MKNLSLFIITVLLFGCQPQKPTDSGETSEVEVADAPESVSYAYELRTYYAAEGKLESLLSRFRDHTLALFEKHGMENIGYWIPVDNYDNTLTYLLRYPSRETRETSWKAFIDDPAWKAAFEASRLDGPLVDSVDNSFLNATDYSPEVSLVDASPRVFEMRTYYTNPGKLDDLHDRFRNATMAIFENHDMTNVVYFNLDQDQEGAQNTLLYFITHADRETADGNWQVFIDDPEWKEVYQASIADGNLVDSLTSRFMTAADFSPLK